MFWYLVLCCVAGLLPKGIPGVPVVQSELSGVGIGQEEGIYPQFLTNNFKLSWPGDTPTDYAQAPTLHKDLVDVTVSMWIKDKAPGDHYQGYFGYGDSKVVNAIRLYRCKYSRYYMNINNNYIHCGVHYTKTVWSHFLMTWSNVKGEIALWIDGTKYCQGILKKGDTIKRGGNFTLGVTPSSWEPLTATTGYNFRGDMAYVNVYEEFVNSTADYEKYRGMARSDPEALIPWEVFRNGTSGNVRISPEYDVYRDAYTHLDCSPNAMTLVLDRRGLSHLHPNKLVLRDGKCGPTTSNDTHIVFTTDLSGCGTLVNFTSSNVVYTNEVAVRGALLPQTHRPGAGDVINRRPVPDSFKRVSLRCEYEMADPVHEPAFAPHINNIHNEGTGSNRFHYQISLFHGENYTKPYGQHEYPIQIEMEERVYVQVAVVGQETRLDNWIKDCRATPSANFNDNIRYDLISKGCPNKADDSIQFHKTTEVGVQRFSFDTFRFNQFPSAVIFLHCDMILCNPDDTDSRCAKGLSIC